MSNADKRPFPINFLHRHGIKLAALAFWLLLIGTYAAIIRKNGLTFEDSVIQLSDWLTSTAWGPLFFIFLYVVGPLLFFPATILSLLGGVLFGPIGIIYTLIGSNMSAMVAFSIGRFFGRGIGSHKDEAGIVQRYTQRIRDNSFQTVLIMHLIFLPYELVNYICGFLQIGWKPFLAGTALGSFMATISVVMMGASFGTIEELLAGDVHINSVTLLTSVLLIGGSIAISRYLRKRDENGV